MRKPMLGTDPEVVGVAKDRVSLERLGLPPDLIDLPIPGAFGLPVADPFAPDIALSFGKLRPDGMAFEFTVDPTNDVDEMVQRIRRNLLETQAIAMQHSGSVITVEPHFFTHPKWIDMLPEDKFGPACSLQVLGCAPDFCVYDTPVPAKPDPRRYLYRTSGGHIHIEVGVPFANDRAAFSFLTAGLDLLLGTAGTYLCKSKSAYDRKQLYGRAGMVRVNDERGILEYRTLPAQALVQTPHVAELMFTAAQRLAGWMLDVYDNMTQPEAILLYRQVIGEYSFLCDIVAMSINIHDVTECVDLQAEFAARLPAESQLADVIDGLQECKLPEDFLLHDWS